MDEKIAAMKLEKEAAIDAQDFEGAASLRDKEQKLIAERAEKEAPVEDRRHGRHLRSR